MALDAGTTLGPYEIDAPIGAGGMGEVYRARDTRLHRDVAVKVLPPAVATDPDRLRRFEQEARAIAALNHPNILAVYDVGEESGLHFIVSELLDGEPLRDKLADGPLPTRRAIDVAVQIARGLAAAHDKGIVHRDLKPENVFVTKDGRVKILDFGLAKPIGFGQSAAAASTMMPTVAGGTEPGLVLGTVGYMSPEQVRGGEVDHRTDIFSFGAVLYELVSGRRAFRRDTAAETMTAILKEDPPDLADVGTPIPAGIERIVRRALEKSPDERFQSTKDLAFALDAVGGTSTVSAVRLERVGRRVGPIAVAVAALALATAGVAGYVTGVRGARGSPVFERLTFQRGYIKGARFTPDGRNVVYSAMWEGRPYEVFTARIGDHTARSLDLHNAMVVGVSAAGDVAVLTNVRRIRSTNFMQVGTLARVPLGGGAPRELLEGVWDADISRDGKQFAVVRTPAGIHQLEYPIGKVVFKTNGYISHPRISPDGRQVAFQEHPLWGDDRGYVALVDAAGIMTRLTDQVDSEQGLVWSTDGREIWYGASGADSPRRAVLAVTPGGTRRTIAHVPGDVAVCDIADDGRLLFSHETVGAAQFVASPGTEERDVSVLGFGMWGALSDDGRTLAFSEEGPVGGSGYLVFVRRLDGSPAIEIGDGTTLGITPDGKAVVALVPGQPTTFRVLPTGAGETRTFDVAPVEVDAYFISWMPGAKEFVFLGHEGDARPRAYRVALAGGPARLVTRQVGAEFWNKVSPDGRFLLQAPGVGMELQGRGAIVDLENGQARELQLADGDQPIAWDQDGRHVFVAQERDAAATIYRLDLSTSKREIWKEIRPADPAGLLSIGRFYVTPSGNAYAYGATRYLSALYTYSKE
jgi:eukaryotic-like serine/threonine-protein kinase